MGPVGDLALRILTLMASAKITAYTGPAAGSASPPSLHHPLGELLQQLLIGRRQPAAVPVPVLCHVSHLVFLLCRKLHR